MLPETGQTVYKGYIKQRSRKSAQQVSTHQLFFSKVLQEDPAKPEQHQHVKQDMQKIGMCKHVCYEGPGLKQQFPGYAGYHQVVHNVIIVNTPQFIQGNTRCKKPHEYKHQSGSHKNNNV